MLILGLALLGGPLACQSTALSLGDPNAINVVLDPEFIEPDTFETQVHLRFLGVEDSTDGSPVSRAVRAWDFGDGLFLWTWQFESNFSLVIGIKRFADAPKGRRTLTLEVYNHFGTFLARGEFTVL